MHPVLFKLGPVTIYTYGVMVALGILVASWILLKLSEAEGLNRKAVADVAFWSIVAGMAGARLFFFLYNPQYLKPWYRILFIWEGGLVWFGGVLAGTATAVALSVKAKLNLWKLADLTSIPLSVGLGIGRIGCTMAGCCYGRVCESPFAIVFKNPKSAAPLNVPLCPTQPLSAVANFAIALVLYLLYRKKVKDGVLFATYAVLYGTFRFLVEFLRATPKDIAGVLSNNQVMSIIMVAVGVAILYIRSSGR